MLDEKCKFFINYLVNRIVTQADKLTHKKALLKHTIFVVSKKAQCLAKVSTLNVLARQQTQDETQGQGSEL